MVCILSTTGFILTAESNIPGLFLNFPDLKLGQFQPTVLQIDNVSISFVTVCCNFENYITGAQIHHFT